MANKKRRGSKQTSNKSNGVKRTVSSHNSLEILAKTAYRERVKVIRQDESLTGQLREGLDYDPIHQKRRIRASVSTMEEVKKRVQHLCPDVPGIYSTDEEWIEINAFPSPAYDYEERFTFSALRCAIWMLDHIRDINRIPLRYITYSGVVKCAEQIVNDDMNHI